MKPWAWLGVLGEHWFGSLSTPSYPLAKAMALGLYCHDCLGSSPVKGKALSGTGLSCVFSCLHILRHRPNPSHIMSSAQSLTYYIIGPIPQLECHHLSICHHSQLSNSRQSFLKAGLRVASSWVLMIGIRRDGVQRNTLDPWQNRAWHALGT